MTPLLVLLQELITAKDSEPLMCTPFELTDISSGSTLASFLNFVLGGYMSRAALLVLLMANIALA